VTMVPDITRKKNLKIAKIASVYQLLQADSSGTHYTQVPTLELMAVFRSLLKIDNWHRVLCKPMGTNH